MRPGPPAGAVGGPGSLETADELVPRQGVEDDAAAAFARASMSTA